MPSRVWVNGPTASRFWPGVAGIIPICWLRRLDCGWRSPDQWNARTARRCVRSFRKTAAGPRDLRRFRRREGEPEHGSTLFPEIGPDRSVVGLDDRAADGETDAHPFGFRTLKGGKEHVAQIFRNSRTGISYHHFDHPVGKPARADVYMPHR